jgi:hypothetical protein
MRGGGGKIYHGAGGKFAAGRLFQDDRTVAFDIGVDQPRIAEIFRQPDLCGDGALIL